MKKQDKMIFILLFFIILGLCLWLIFKPKENKQDMSIDVKNAINIDICDLKAKRLSNVVALIGANNRKYYSQVNEFNQIVKVEAKQITKQEKSEERVKGRYCEDEARVNGTQEKNLDQGHIIADSLGGASNTYNITPQNSTLNRIGEQSKMEKYMVKMLTHHHKITDFIATIKYPNTKTLIPSHYNFSFKVDNEVKSYSFDNK